MPVTASPSAPTPRPADVTDLRERVRQTFASVRADLESLVRIPSVSNADFDQAHVAASAQRVADLLTGVGMTDVQILTADRPDGTPGAPAVVARRPAPEGAPTVLLYAHHDVQPVGDESVWQTPPFEPTQRGERLFGRGAADDGAGLVAHIGALRVLGDELGVGVTVFVEGEEEVGSPSFGNFLRTYRDLLAADVMIVADSSNWKVGVPALTTSLRGLVDTDVEVAVIDHAIHSGMYGGPVLDAVTLLCRLVATLHDERGDVAVAGLLTAADPAIDYDEADFRADTSLLPGTELAGTGPITARLWTKPTIAVIGLDAPSVPTASNTITPRATARLSMRIAPGQDPVAAQAALRTHLEEHAPFGARVTVTDNEVGKAYQAPADSSAMQAARQAFADAWGTEPVDTGIGGSIPFVADLVEVFPEAAILVTGVEDPDSRAHGANESVHLGELENVVLAEALLLTRLAQ